MSGGFPFEGVPVTFAIIGGDGTLSVTQTTTNTDGKAESTLTLGPNLGPYTVSVSAAGVEQPVTFTAVAGEGVTIPDSNLQAAIRTALGAAADVQIVPSKLATLTYLEARNATIGHLTGLEFATNLRYLNLNGNSVSDLSPVAGLTNLTTLNLNDNSVSDLSPVADLTNLRTLNLNGNSVSDLSGVSDLTNLTTLNLNDNSVSDLSPVADLTNLRTLNLNGNSVSDIPRSIRLNQPDNAESWEQFGIGPLRGIRLNQPDNAASWRQQFGIGPLPYGGLNQPDMAESWGELDIGYIGVGGLN